MLGGALVWVWLVLGLRVLSNGGAWHVGWGGAIVVGTLLWPAFAAGYFSLKRLAFSSSQDREDELADLDSFSKLPHGGLLNLMMSVLALHMLAWGAAAATHWAVAAWRDKDRE